jgi:hypothetical protein
MKMNSNNRIPADSSPSNFFDVNLQQGTGNQIGFPQPALGMQQSYSRPASIIQPNYQSPQDHSGQGFRPLNNPSQQNIQANVRASSPNKGRMGFDNDPKPSITSFDRNPLPRRPMSQVPTGTRGPNSSMFDQPTNQPPNFRPGPPQNAPLLGNQQAPVFGQTQSSYQFSQSGLQFGMSREALRDNIIKKGQLVTELTQNKNFFRENLDKKNTDFKEFIRNELKKTVFDKVLKTNLHYIYKHYENLKTTVNRDDTLRILNTNLAKQQMEMAEGKRTLGQLEGANKGLEERLLSTVNQPGVIKVQPTIVENITKEDMDRKVVELRKENAEIEQAIDALKRKRDKELYDLKMKHENKGRILMEQRAIKLALQYVDPQDPEQLALKNRIEEMLQVIEGNDGARKSSQNYVLTEKKEKLERELEVLKFYSA